MFFFLTLSLTQLDFFLQILENIFSFPYINFILK